MDYKKLAIIGGSLVGAGALFYYFFSSSKTTEVKVKNGKTLSREVVISTLKQLKKELFTVCLQMSMMAAEMKKYSQGRLDYDIKDFIFSYPTISQEMQSSIKRAYDKNNITEADFQYNCEVTFADDKEIQTLMKAVKEMVDSAAEGKQMNVETEIPEFLTQEKVLEIIEKIMIETTKAMQQMFKKIKDQYGELNLNDPRIQRQLQGLQADEIKTNIFNEYNLEDFDDPAQKIIQFATQKYAQEQPEFQEKMMQLELKQRKSMEIIMQNPDNEEIVDKIFKEPNQNLGMGGMGGNQFPGFHSSRRKNQAEAPKKEEVKVEVKTEEKTEVAPPAEEQQKEEAAPSGEEKVEESNAEEKVEEHPVEEKAEEQLVEEKVEQRQEETTTVREQVESEIVNEQKVEEAEQVESQEAN